MFNGQDDCEGFSIYHYTEVSSTNTIALDFINRGISKEAIIIADKQTRGRGRTEKSWLSIKGNFHASFIINQATTDFVFISALAVGNTLLSFIDNLNIRYKWPNDIMIDEKKISGILLQKKSNSNWLIIGIGINIVSAPLIKTTCMKSYGKIVSSIDILRELIKNFKKLRNLWQYHGFCVIKEMWLKRALKLREQMRVKLDDKLYEGTFINIDECGRLILKQEKGNLIYLNTGELFDIL